MEPIGNPISGMMGEKGKDKKAGAEKQKAFEYTGTVASEAISGEVKIRVEEEGIFMTSPLDAFHIPYADVTSFGIDDYVLSIEAWGEAFRISKMGNFLEGLYNDLYNAYNRKVIKALFVEGGRKFDTSGEYSYSEDGANAVGKAKIAVYDDCVTILPPNDCARRIPLCFVAAMEKKDFELTLRLNTGDSYSFIRLGRDLDPFVGCIEGCLRKIRDKSLKNVKELDNKLNPMQQQKIAKLMPEGAAVPIGRLNEIAPSFVSMVEKKISEGGADAEYDAFKRMCDPMGICVGMKSELAGKNINSAAPQKAEQGPAESAEPAPAAEKTKGFIWMIAPGKKEGTAAVEFAVSDEAAATFLYSSFTDYNRFWERLNQAMEAIDFRRNVISMTEEELSDPKNSDTAMAVRRNSALKFVRSHFTGRAIHSSPQSWEKNILEHMG